MNRRHFLSFLASLPLIGWMIPKQRCGQEPFTASYWVLNAGEWQHRTKSTGSSKNAFSEVRGEDGEFRDFAVWHDVLTPEEVRAIISGSSPLTIERRAEMAFCGKHSCE